MQFIEYFLTFIVIIIIFFYLKNYYAEVTYVKSKIDNEYYLVRRLVDKEQAADALAALAAELTKLIKHLVAKYPNNPDIKRLYENFNNKNMSESSPDSGYTSYSVDKGKRLVLCLRHKNANNTFVDTNTIKYVAIHELSHLGVSDIGHTPHFWEFFRMILQEAVAIGVYTKIDYSQKPVDFCGIKITSSVI